MRFNLTVCLGLMVVLCGCSHVRKTETAAAPVRIGTDEVEITPPIGFRMAGYFDERTSTAVHDPLHAKAIVLEQGKTAFVFVFCDLLGVSLRVSKTARQQASQHTGIPVENIMVCASHAHTGPLFDDVRRDFFHAAAVAKFGSDPKETVDYPALLETRIADAIERAAARLKPCSLLSGEGELQGLSFNRRYYMTNGTVQTNPGIRNPAVIGPAGPVDRAVPVLQARDADGKALAVVTTFACHCDTCGGTQYSADYPFYLEQGLQGDLGATVLSAFAAGPCGDINHIDVNHTNGFQGFANSEHIGKALAEAVLATPLRQITRPCFAVRSRTITVPLQTVTTEQVEKARSRMSLLDTRQISFAEKVQTVKEVDLSVKGREWPMEVQVFRLDKQTALVCLPGEIFTELGLEIKKRSPFPHTTVMTICNDRPAYVPTAKAFKEGSYEVTNSRVQPGTGEKLVRVALGLLRELQ